MRLSKRDSGWTWKLLSYRYGFHSLAVIRRLFMSDKLSSSAVLNLLASVTSEFVNVAIQNVMLKENNNKNLSVRLWSAERQQLHLNLLPDYQSKAASNSFRNTIKQEDTQNKKTHGLRTPGSRSHEQLFRPCLGSLSWHSRKTLVRQKSVLR